MISVLVLLAQKSKFSGATATVSAGYTPTYSCGTNGINTALGCLPTNPQDFINAAFPWLLGVAGAAAFLLIILGAFQYVTASGNPEQMQHAQEQIVSALTGLLLIILSIVILKVIGIDVLGIPGFEG